MEKKIYLSDDIAERLIKMGGPFPMLRKLHMYFVTFYAVIL